MQRTTVSIEDDLISQIRKRAAKEQRNLSSIINALLRQSLRGTVSAAGRRHVRWKTFSAGQVYTDVNDRDALEATMSDR